jgi:PAS domain S-box-containing protein
MPRRKKKPATPQTPIPTATNETPSTPPNTKRSIEQLNKPAQEQPAQEQPAMPDTKPSGSDSEQPDYDLRPPSSKPKTSSLEDLAGWLFSEEYLTNLISEPQLLARFSAFLSRYKPDLSPLVLQYIESQKVIKAVDYANAIASIINGSKVKPDSRPAAELSDAFRDSSQHAFKTLLSTAVPAWVTYTLVKTSTSCLTAEITNQATPLTRDLVGGLSEVFCITDPNRDDNPIVYASEEFYRLTGYGKDAIIGHNCRFLQGPKTKHESVSRLKAAIAKGEEISETLLNHRRDGTPFINVLLLAPLHDDKGNVKYYLGAQVDASRLVEGGRGVDGFERFLAKKQMQEERVREEDSDPKRNALAKLRDLSMTFDLEESAIVQSNSRSNSATRTEDGGTKNTERRRKRIQDDDETSDSEGSEDEDDGEWKLSRDDSSRKLPGIYKKYLLIRPYPSLRTIFVSEAARKLGHLQQHPFLAHAAAPPATLTGLKDALLSGTPVTAKIALMSQPGKTREGTVTGKWGKKNDGPAEHGKTYWISATPLRDGADKVGVWMVVIVDRNSVASNTGRKLDEKMQKEARIKQLADASQNDLDLPIKPKQVGLSLEDDEPAPNNIDSQPSDILTEAKLPTNGNEKDSGIGDDIDGSQRSAGNHVPNGVCQPSNNALSTESPPGSPPLSPNSSISHSLDLDPDLLRDRVRNGEITPPRTDQEEQGSDQTPRQTDHCGAGAPQDVGLRAMDYLTSRSPMAKRRLREEGHQDDDFGDSDWNVASPYSVD